MNEDKTSQNDELEANDTSYEDNTETEETASEAQEQTESGDSDGEDSVTLSRAELEERLAERAREQDKRWKDRIKHLEGKEGGQESREKSNQKGDSQEGVASKEELDRFRLETKGIEDSKQQDFVLKYAKLEGLTVAQALNDEFVSARLEKYAAEAEKGRATQSPINRTGKPREKTPEELAREAEKGVIPKTKDQRKAALKALQSKYGRT